MCALRANRTVRHRPSPAHVKSTRSLDVSRGLSVRLPVCDVVAHHVEWEALEVVELFKLGQDPKPAIEMKSDSG